ncbi:MAG: hypothetical protein R2716_13480 [Microthrixaceae bacterium]
MLKALFIISAYIVVLLSTNYMAEGDYWESECITRCCSARCWAWRLWPEPRPIGIFVAFELLSIPSYMLGRGAKGDLRSNEAGLKIVRMACACDRDPALRHVARLRAGRIHQLSRRSAQIASLGTDGVPVVASPCCS